MSLKLLFAALLYGALAYGATVVSECGTPADPGSSSVSTMSVTCTPASGSYLVIFAVTSPSTATQTIADGGVGNTITVASVTNLGSFPNLLSTSGSARYNMWLVATPINTATTFTVTNSSASAFNSLQVIQITGLASAAPDCANHALNAGSSSLKCAMSGASDAIIGVGNQYAAPGCTAAGSHATGDLTTQLFKSTGSGGYGGDNADAVSPGTFGTGFTCGAAVDTFLITIKTTVVAGSATQIGGFLVGP